VSSGGSALLDWQDLGLLFLCHIITLLYVGFCLTAKSPFAILHYELQKALRILVQQIKDYCMSFNYQHIMNLAVKRRATLIKRLHAAQAKFDDVKCDQIMMQLQGENELISNCNQMLEAA
jgi:hypothetical protein